MQETGLRRYEDAYQRYRTPRLPRNRPAGHDAPANKGWKKRGGFRYNSRMRIWSSALPTWAAPAMAFAACFALETPVGAYLDPGSGSMILQVLLGGFAAVGVVAKLYWHQLKARLLGRKDVDDNVEPDSH